MQFLIIALGIRKSVQRLSNVIVDVSRGINLPASQWHSTNFKLRCLEIVNETTPVFSSEATTSLPSAVAL
jgi:hypothetical protein